MTSSNHRHMVVPHIRHIADYAKRLGLRRTVLRSAYVGLNQLMTLSVFEAMTLRRHNINAGLLGAGDLECRMLGLDEMLRFAEVLGGEAARNLARAGEHGDLAYAVLDDGELANVAFFSARPTPLLRDLEMHFAPQHWYMYGGATMPAYRGRRLHAASVLGGAAELFSRGVSMLVTVYEATNYPSEVSALRMGWQPAGRLYRVAAGPWTRFGANAGARALGMRLENSEEAKAGEP